MAAAGVDQRKAGPSSTRARPFMLVLLLASCSGCQPVGGRPAAPTLVAPNTSLATIPAAYFGGKGGKSGKRSAANLAMLAKMRLIMLEKW